jgi:hypothetical protein
MEFYSINEILQMSRQQLIDLNLMDPVRVFVKNEPHKVKKLNEGRVRLIMSVSLTDKVIEMILSRHICKLEIANWKNIPSKPGIGFTDDDCQDVFKDVMESGFDLAEADAEGWDWSVDEWQIRDEAEGCIKLCNSPSLVWSSLMRKKAIVESRSVYQLSDGTLLSCLYNGNVNSGKLRTSRGNSFMRVRVADLIGSRKTIAAGDDSVESYVEGAVAKYLEFGLVMKEYKSVKNTFEFCSRVYGDGFSYPINSFKMLMNLLHSEPRNFFEYKMFMLGFCDEMHGHPEYDYLLDMIEQVGYNQAEGPHYI